LSPFYATCINFGYNSKLLIVFQLFIFA